MACSAVGDRVDDTAWDDRAVFRCTGAAASRRGMTLAVFLDLVLSIGGALAAVAAVTVWLIARPHARAPRICLASIVLGYAAISTYPIPHAMARSLRAPFTPLARAD